MSITPDLVEVLNWHPEMLLIARNPLIFEGFLFVSKNSNMNYEYFMKMRLRAPFFPSAKDMSVSITTNLKFVLTTECKVETFNKFCGGTSVCSFIEDLKRSLILQRVKI